MLPFNIYLLLLDREVLRNMRPVSSLDHFAGGTDDFHEDGLFSVQTFGRVGSEERDRRFSYIDIKTTIFHPVIYQRLVQLKGLYKDIMSGKRYATWDPKEGDFVPASEMNGETGYHFFMKHWQDIKFKQSNSLRRKLRIDLIEKYKDRATTDKVLVLPAGLRDLTVDEEGRKSEDEINSLYRRVLSIANTIGVRGRQAEDAVFDNARHSLQMAFNDIYNTIENLLTGKKGFFQKKWGSRRIFNGTRNVISAMDTSVKVLGQPNNPGFNDTVVGLYQLIKAALPVTKHLLLTGYLSQVFSQSEGKALLVNKKTLRPEYVDVGPEVFDQWATPEGIERVINNYFEMHVREKPIEFGNHYLGLIYIGKGDDNFRIFNDIEDLPSFISRDEVHPLNLCQLIYLSGYQRWNTLRGFVTRYPITGPESIYPTRIYVKTTLTGEMRWELDENWERIGDDHVALEFPKLDMVGQHVESLVVHSSRLKPIGGD